MQQLHENIIYLIFDLVTLHYFHFVGCEKKKMQQK